MSTSFEQLRKQRGDLKSLSDKLEKLNSKTNFKDESDGLFWKPTVDKAGNGFAIIRFLSAPDGEDV